MNLDPHCLKKETPTGAKLERLRRAYAEEDDLPLYELARRFNTTPPEVRRLCAELEGGK